jgi:phage tail-like protein
MAMRFNVVIDGISLGNWASCKGLEFTCKPIKFHEHGNYEYETILFVDVSYSVIKLERAVDRVASAQLREWLANELNDPPGTQIFGGGKTATITLLDAAWSPVMSWTLRGVYPAGWTGPALSAKDTAVATERLELMHEGFL